MAFKTTYSQYDNKTGLILTGGALDLTTIPSNENKITASDGAVNDIFGDAVAIGNGRIVVGAYKDDDNGSSSGSAYIFNQSGTQLAKITASDGAANDWFGRSIDIGNGRIVVGAEEDNTDEDLSLLVGTSDLQSEISSEDLQNLNVIRAGSAYIFNLSGTLLAKITASDGAANDTFGDAVAVGSGRIVVGAQYHNSASGSAYIFDLDGTQLAKINASDGHANDQLGNAVAIGNGRIVVGAYGDDFMRGSAYIFDLNGTQLAKITASDRAFNDAFGSSVAVGSGRIVVGAPYDDSVPVSTFKGSAYIFDLNGTQLAKITASDGAASDNFGLSVAIDNGRIVVGAYGDDSNKGSAYIFDLDGTQLTKITASDGAAGDYFGWSVAVGN